MNERAVSRDEKVMATEAVVNSGHVPSYGVVECVARFAIPLLVSTVCVFGTSSAIGQDYPSKPIRYIVPDSPGVPSDIVARIMAPRMSTLLGQPIVVENRPGAGQMIGYEYVAKQAPADGYTLVAVSVPVLATSPATVKDLRFDPRKDLPPVIGLAGNRLVLGSSSRLPWKTFNEMVAYAKMNPGKLSYGSPIPTLRLLSEVLIRGLGLNVLYVPYAGGGPYTQALVGGEIQLGFIGEPGAISFGEKFRALAVTGAQRSPSFRDVPTFAELGYPQIPGFSYSLNVRAGTPKDALDKLYAAASRVLQQPEAKPIFAKVQLEISNETPGAAARSLAEQTQLFADVAKTIGLKPE